MKVVCKEDDDGNVMFECPGCGCLHKAWVTGPSAKGAKWTWNNRIDAPTIRPSIDISVDFTLPSRPSLRCHSFVTDGKIQFLSDCTHELAGQTVDLPEWECEHEWEFVDDSFDHEYGCERIFYERCLNCLAEREHDPPTFGDEVI